jgi:cytoskeletal protein CcmA (bactofilin family)
MKTIKHKIEGDVRIEENTTLSGMVTGNVSVGSGVSLLLSGMVVGRLTLEPSSSVELRGMVNGEVENRGGHLEVWGMVNGEILRQGGTTIVHPKAVVN